jgi:hypothetical protein
MPKNAIVTLFSREKSIVQLAGVFDNKGVKEVR